MITIIKEGSDIPVPVPSIFFDCTPYFVNQYGVTVCPVIIIHFTTDWYDLLQCRAQHPAKPNAFSLSLITHSIHTIVPISSTNQRQAMLTKSESIFHRTDTMVIKGETFSRELWLAISVIITLFYPVSYTHLRAHETRHDLVCRLLLEKKKKNTRKKKKNKTYHNKKKKKNKKNKVN